MKCDPVDDEIAHPQIERKSINDRKFRGVLSNMLIGRI